MEAGRRFCTATALLLAFSGRAACAQSAPKPRPAQVSIDPRLELLGVVQRLAGRSVVAPDDVAYAREVDRYFGPWRDHPAVRLYAEIAADDWDPLGVILLYYSPPPELALKDPEARVPYLDAESQQLRALRFLRELRAFAEASDFAGFYRSHAPLYLRAENAAREELTHAYPVPPEQVLSRYLGVDLSMRRHYALSLLYNPRLRNSFIVPYPDPAMLGDYSGGFDVYTLGLFLDGRPRRDNRNISLFEVPSREIWQEPAFVFVEPALYWFERIWVPDRASFYGAATASCRDSGVDCVKDALVAALLSRLDRQEPLPDARRRGLAAALGARLKEYESQRARYPTLWDFMPRLMSVFSEQSSGRSFSPAGGARPLASPRSVDDFFTKSGRATLEAR